MILAILAATLCLFLYGRWRHDIVAATALLATVLVGLVPADQAFSGFSHPAVTTVACVLILSSALLQTGVVDMLAERLLPTEAGPTLTIAALVTLSAVLSSFMNNVGALALLMPMALQIAKRQQLAPGKILMPLAFGTILGGMMTLIGTPSNLIVSDFRNRIGAGAFDMFAFTPVGVTVAAGGVLFVALIGWRIVPARERAGADAFDTAAYLTEARVAPNSKAIGMTLHEAETELEAADAQIISLVRNEIRLRAPHAAGPLREGDLVLIEADQETLAKALDSLGLVFGAPQPDADDDTEEHQDPESDGTGTNSSSNTSSSNTSTSTTSSSTSSSTSRRSSSSSTDGDAKEQAEQEKKIERLIQLDDAELVELVVLPGSSLLGRSASDLSLRDRFGINLLAISRQGSRIRSRVRHTALRHGDVLLMQGPGELIAEFAANAGCAPLAARALRAPDRRKMILACTAMAIAIGVTALDLLPAAISFLLGVVLLMLFRVLPLRKLYEAVDWPVIVLLAALLPVAQATESTGAAQLIAELLMDDVAQGNAIVALTLVLLVTMFMSDVINNAATAAIMCPIAISAATQLQVSADPFLMVVAIGASAAFLTPIGHQNNTLILGPGGFRFGDYWRMGLPLEIVVTLIAIPMLLVVWPL